MPNPSYYFNLFKKFQVLNHVPSQSVHGNAGAPTGGFNLNDPNAPFNPTFTGTPITAGDFVPAKNPLWAVLNARANGVNPFPPSVVIPGGAQAGTTWPAMPPGPTNTGAFAEFQTNPPVKLVDVFATWITNGQVRDIQPAQSPPNRRRRLQGSTPEWRYSSAACLGIPVCARVFRPTSGRHR